MLALVGSEGQYLMWMARVGDEPLGCCEWTVESSQCCHRILRCNFSDAAKCLLGLVEGGGHWEIQNLPCYRVRKGISYICET